MIAKFALYPSPQEMLGGRATAVIVLVPGSNSDGRGMIHDPTWVKFARAHNCALVGCYFADDQPSMAEAYCDLRGPGSQAAVDLTLFLAKTYDKIPPLLVWGFSAGGQFAYELTCWASSGHYVLAGDRRDGVQTRLNVAGFVVNKGGIYYTHLASEEARAVPGLLIIGRKDSLWRQRSVEGIAGVNMAMGAGWSLTMEDCGHEVCNSVALGQKFFSDILKELGQ